MLRLGRSAGFQPVRSRRTRRILRRMAIVLLIVVAILATYHGVASMLVSRADAAAPRDPETGVRIGAEELDLGPRDAEVAVLLVHGFIGGSNNFWELPQRLAEQGWRARAIRLPGHGTSPRELAETPTSELQLAVLREIRALKKEHDQVFIVAHSMGGALSILAASIEEVDGMVLGAPYFGVTHQWYYGLTPELWSALTGPIVRWTYKGDAFLRVNRPEAKERIFSYRWIPSHATESLVHIGELARDPYPLSQIRCPVLIFHSKTDFAASAARTEAAFEEIASEDKEFIWLDNSDHHVFWDYDRDEVVARTISFIEEHASARP